MLKRATDLAVRGRRGKNQVPTMVQADAPQSVARPGGRNLAARRPLLEMWLPADPQAVPAARHQALEVCRRAGVGEEDCFSLDIALGEALANAVVHGIPAYAPEGDDSVKDICLCVWNFHDRIIIEVHDQGPGFDPPPPPYPMPLAGAQDTHGRGLPLMELLTDALIVCRGDAEEGGASVYLVKNRLPLSGTER